MRLYTVIVENDESQWEDVPGIQYQFPPRYVKHLPVGTIVLYYKGKLKDKKYRFFRLTDEPHYFATGVIQEIRNSRDGKSFFAIIGEFSLFTQPVSIRQNGVTLETIPDNLTSNFWRYGVRPITKEIYERVLSVAGIEQTENVLNDQGEQPLITIELDGGRKKIYTTVYERSKSLRDQAIKIHGYSCMACGFNFHEKYGELGEGYIHVHHKQPLSDFEEKVTVNPQTDLAVVCANCHSMIHRKKNKVLTLEELQAILMTLKVR